MTCMRGEGLDFHEAYVSGVTAASLYGCMLPGHVAVQSVFFRLLHVWPGRPSNL